MDPSSQPELTPELLEANPGLAIALSLFSLVLFAAIAGTLTCWTLLGMSWFKGKTILPVKSWSPRPWGLADICIGVILMVVSQILLTAIAAPMLGIDMKALATEAQAEGNAQVPLTLAAVISASYLVAVVLITMWILLRFQSNLQETGWSIQRLPKLALVGLVGGLAFLPFLFGLNAIVAITSEAEYNHPILDAMKADGTPVSYLLALFSAVLVAPIAEEFLFRGFLQGWLQSLPNVSLPWALIGRVGPSPAVALSNAIVEANGIPAGEIGGGSAITPSDSGTSSQNPFATSEAESAHETSGVAVEPSTGVVPAIWPSIVAGTLFGFAHWGYGLSFIPLIALGIFLGLLYRATQSLWPCIIVHFMLNASSMAALGLGVLIEKATG